MKPIRVIVFGMAVLLPTTWTIAKAGDDAPSSETKTTTKKSKRSKKSADGSEKTETDKTEKKTEKSN